MTPTLQQILTGNAVAIASLAGETGGAAFAASRLTVVAMLGLLAAQEAERGVAVRVAENAMIAAVIGETAATDELTIAALDRVNAELRRKLIAYHAAVEGDPARDAAVLALYRRMAEGRLLVLPPH